MNNTACVLKLDDGRFNKTENKRMRKNKCVIYNNSAAITFINIMLNKSRHTYKFISTDIISIHEGKEKWFRIIIENLYTVSNEIYGIKKFWRQKKLI